jgi:hypothetical protein
MGKCRVTGAGQLFVRRQDGKQGLELAAKGRILEYRGELPRRWKGRVEELEVAQDTEAEAAAQAEAEAAAQAEAEAAAQAEAEAAAQAPPVAPKAPKAPQAKK